MKKTPHLMTQLLLLNKKVYELPGVMTISNYGFCCIFH